MTVPEFVIQVDTREGLPYEFLDHDVQTVHEKMDSGDYGIVGLSGIAIERKTPTDILSCMSHGRERFIRELERLQEFEYSAVVIECDFPDLFSGMHSGMNKKSIAETLSAWAIRFPKTDWWLMPDRRWGEAWTFRLLERFHRDTLDGKRPAAGEGTAA